MSLQILNALCSVREAILSLLTPSWLIPNDSSPRTAPKMVRIIPSSPSFGAIGLDAFVDGSGPMPSTVRPEFHNAKTLTLHAPSDNAQPIYYGFTPDVRAYGSSTNYLGSELIVNGGFSSGTGWIDNEWNIASNKISLVKDSIGSRQTYDFKIATALNLDRGYYQLTADVTVVNITFGSVEVNAYSNLEYLASNGSGNISTSFWHPGGPCIIGFAAIVSPDEGEESEVSIDMDNVSLKRKIFASHVGTPLLPGQTVDLSRLDYSQIDEVYIVATEGDTDSDVIANYSY